MSSQNVAAVPPHAAPGIENVASDDRLEIMPLAVQVNVS